MFHIQGKLEKEPIERTRVDGSRVLELRVIVDQADEPYPVRVLAENMDYRMLPKGQEVDIVGVVAAQKVVVSGRIDYTNELIVRELRHDHRPTHLAGEQVMWWNDL